VFWVGAKLAPIGAGGLIAWLFPRGYQEVAGVTAMFLTQQILDPLSLVRQLRWNGRMAQYSTHQPSAFYDNSRNPASDELSVINDLAAGDQTGWQITACWKLRTVEPTLRGSVVQARKAHARGDIDSAIQFAADCVVDYLVRWPYLALDSKVFGPQMRHLFKPFRGDGSFRWRLVEEVMTRDLVIQQGVRRTRVERLLDEWKLNAQGGPVGEPD
jgi:hypothetical protein